MQHVYVGVICWSHVCVQYVCVQWAQSLWVQYMVGGGACSMCVRHTRVQYMCAVWGVCTCVHVYLVVGACAPGRTGGESLWGQAPGAAPTPTPLEAKLSGHCLVVAVAVHDSRTWSEPGNHHGKPSGFSSKPLAATLPTLPSQGPPCLCVFLSLGPCLRHFLSVEGPAHPLHLRKHPCP